MNTISSGAFIYYFILQCCIMARYKQIFEIFLRNCWILIIYFLTVTYNALIGKIKIPGITETSTGTLHGITEEHFDTICDNYLIMLYLTSRGVKCNRPDIVSL